MTRDVELACKCGQVHGWLRGVSPHDANRVVCYCDDCQAFAHHIGRADLLDAHGGSDIVQVAPAAVSFDRGMEHVTAVRLHPKGLYRWYSSCCKTPLGNTMSPSVPFIGIGRQALEAEAPDQTFGPVRAWLQAKYAVGTPPNAVKTVSLPFLGRTLRLLVSWKLRGKSWPHPFFDRASKAPVRPVPVLSKAEREALRPLCGPRPR